MNFNEWYSEFSPRMTGFLILVRKFDVKLCPVAISCRKKALQSVTPLCRARVGLINTHLLHSRETVLLYRGSIKHTVFHRRQSINFLLFIVTAKKNTVIMECNIS